MRNIDGIRTKFSAYTGMLLRKKKSNKFLCEEDSEFCGVVTAALYLFLTHPLPKIISSLNWAEGNALLHRAELLPSSLASLKPQLDMLGTQFAPCCREDLFSLHGQNRINANCNRNCLWSYSFL